MAARIRPKTPIPPVHYYVREHRLDKEFTQEEFAARLGSRGVSKGTVSRWETGERKVDLGTALAICEVLKISLEQLKQLPSPKIEPDPPKPKKLTKAEKKMLDRLVADFLAKRRSS